MLFNGKKIFAVSRKQATGMKLMKRRVVLGIENADSGVFAQVNFPS